IPTATAIPTLSEWALILLGFLVAVTSTEYRKQVPSSVLQERNSRLL
ncbi:MAG: IPTL-CTERM sorting domain-containing protein, partial [Phycisphaerales bacterium]|nr:IPTL-CTERM sorting domain-containing protein [Phycisphaerales bacterium]